MSNLWYEAVYISEGKLGKARQKSWPNLVKFSPASREKKSVDLKNYNKKGAIQNKELESAHAL